MAKRPAFQRRHFKAVAEIIRKARLRPNDDIAEAIDDIEQDLADLFRADNPALRGPALLCGVRPDLSGEGAVNQQQKDDIEVFARWQQLGLIEDAELIARKARYARQAMDVLVECMADATRRSQETRGRS